MGKAKSEITQSGNKYVSTGKAAEMLKLSRRAIYNRMDDGDFTCFRKGRNWYIMKSEVQALSPRKSRAKKPATNKRNGNPAPGALDLSETMKLQKTGDAVHPTVSLTVAVTQCYGAGMGPGSIQELVNAALVACKQHPTIM